MKPVTLAVAALSLCVIVPALAQVAPPTRRDDNAKPPPHYVDSADYDRQPYYVDGVEYKPYVPEKKKAKNAADTVKAPAAQTAPAYVSPKPTADNELHPYVAPTPAKPDTTAAAPPKVARSESSSSTTAAVDTYVRKKRPRYGVAIIEALDKISSESVRFEAPIGQPVRYKGLIYTVKACETTADDEPMNDVVAYMQVRTNPVTAANAAQTTKSKEIFRGWTYASTPSLNPLQHPVYDAWVIACRKPLAVPAATTAAKS